MIPRPTLAQSAHNQQSSAGFTLFESVTVILVLGILSVYAAPKSFNNNQITLKAQAQTLASDLQRAQLLATTSGKSVYFCALSTAYLVQIVDTVGTTCPVSVPTQASPLQPVVVKLDRGSIFSSATSVLFDSLGKPSSSTSFVLSSAPAGSGAITVSTADVTGLVSISP